jgi:benzoyl-CoA reductase/2-hydroxyglutaryl-CoA dehydratase subunit BcrC/BadD/HgdB
VASEEKKVRPINRLRTLKEVRPLVDKLYQEGIEAASSGKPVAWAMVNWWHADAILRAMDFVAIYPENYGAACAAAGAAPEYLSRCEAAGFPTHLCGYARNCLGYTQKMIELGEVPPDAPMGGMAKPLFLLSSGFFCDARFKWFQALGRYWEVPVWVMEVALPKARESLMEGVFDYSMKFMVAELREFVAFLEQLRGRKMNWDVLSEVVDTQEKVLRTWHEINELRKTIPCPMHSRDFWTMMVPAFYRAGEKTSLELYQKVLEEVKQRVANKIGSLGAGTPEEEKYRLVFLELPPWHSLGFFDRLAEKGWNFVIESWNYHPPPPLKLEGINDPLERLARHSYWFYTNLNRSAVAGGRTAGTPVEAYVQWASQYKYDGALIHPLISCRYNAVYPLHVRDVLLSEAMVPSLVAPGDIVDLTVFDEAQVLSQADAFIEPMAHYKKLRKEKGLSY